MCTNCSEGTSSSFTYSLPVSNNGCGSIDSQNVNYTGPYLSCLDVQSGTCLQDILQSINTKVCANTGDYTQYNVHCLSSSYTITDEASFVSAITDYSCNLSTTVSTLATTVSSNYTTLTAAIAAVNSPGLTSNCSLVVYNSSSTLKQVLNALNSAICSLNTSQDVSSVDWDSCLTTTSTPTTVVDGFNEVIRQICLVRSSITASGTLPTFDNTGTCLTSPTAADTLYDTIIKIRTRLCTTPTFDAGNLSTSSCVAFTDDSTLEEVISLQNTLLDTLAKGTVRAISSDFTLTDVDGSQPCLGKKLSLNSTVVDRKVALNSADTAAGTLEDKFAEGDGISLDFGNLNSGKLTITATTQTSTDEKVKVNSSDATTGYLENKIQGVSSDGVTVTTQASSDNSKVNVTVTLDFATIAEQVLAAIAGDTELSSTFCALVSSCPVACAAPTDVTVSQVS